MNFHDEREQRLVLEIKKGSYTAYLELLKRYENLLMSIAWEFKHKYFYLPLEFEDYLNYASFIFKKIVIEYIITSKKTFPMYVKTFLHFYVSNFVKSYANKNSLMMSNFIPSLEDENENILDEEYLLEDVIELINSLNFLTNLEKRVLEYLIDDKNPMQISLLISKNISAVYGIIGRAKRKITSYYKI